MPKPRRATCHLCGFTVNLTDAGRIGGHSVVVVAGKVIGLFAFPGQRKEGQIMRCAGSMRTPP